MSLTEKNTAQETTENVKKSPLSLLVYGGPGSGKTYFATTMDKPFILAVDPGLIKAKMEQRDVSYVEPQTYDEVSQALSLIKQGKLAKGRKSIVLDHATMLTDLAVQKVLAENSAQKMTLQLWGYASSYVRELLKEFFGLGKFFHTCAIFHEHIDKDELRGEVLGLPSTIGKLATEVGGFVDLFLYAKQETFFKDGKPAPEWKFYSVNLGSFKAKDRLGVLGVAEPNDFNTIYTKFQEGIYHGRN